MKKEHRAIFYGFTGEIGKEIIKKLSDKSIRNVFWIGSDKDSNIDIVKFLLFPPTDYIVSKKAALMFQKFFQKTFLTYTVMALRRGLYWRNFHEMRNEFAMYYYYLYDILEKNEIDLIVFSNLVHEGPDYILYQLAKDFQKKTLMCYQSIFPNRFFTTTSLEDFGRFNNIPNIFSGSIKIEKSFRQHLFYMEKIHREMYEKSYIGIKIGRTIQFLKKSWFYLKKRREKPLFFDLFLKAISFKEDRGFQKRLNKNQIQDSEVRELLRKKKSIYFPLHMQPELETSTLGDIFEEQITAVEMLSAEIPDDWIIFLKENPKQTSFQRGNYFFSRIRAISKVKLVPITFSSEELIANSSITATISGTAGWEAIKGGKACIVFGRTWFQYLPYVYCFKSSLCYNKISEEIIDTNILQKGFDGLMERCSFGVVDSCYSHIVENFSLHENSDIVSESLIKIIFSPNTKWD